MPTKIAYLCHHTPCATAGNKYRLLGNSFLFIYCRLRFPRLLFAILHSALTEDHVLGRKRVFLNLHPALVSSLRKGI